MIGFGFSAQWGPFSYFLVPFIPVFILEFCVYPWEPHLDTPHIPFEKWAKGLTPSQIARNTLL